MKRLSKTVFCDATYHVTVYVYKVVMLTTLDGNHQHRPLMVSFITESTAIQWQIIFNIFYRYRTLPRGITVITCTVCVPCGSVMQADSPDDIFVITSDQEKAILAGLQKSALKEKALHMCCSLHAKWSKCLCADDECL